MPLGRSLASDTTVPNSSMLFYRSHEWQYYDAQTIGLLNLAIANTKASRVTTSIGCPTKGCNGSLVIPDEGGSSKCPVCKEEFPFLAVTKSKRLKNCGTRLVQLLENHKVKNSPAIQAALDDLLGAVYALCHAQQHDFQDRPSKKIEIDVVVTRAKQIRTGVVRTNGKWIAGWYFNSALFRIAAIYHRLLKAVTGHDKDVGDLVADAELTFWKKTRKSWNKTNVGGIHTEVNELKHGRNGVYFRRKARFDEAVSAIEELLALLEVWAK